MLRPIQRPSGPRRPVAKITTDGDLNTAPVGDRVLRDALQLVEPTDPDVHVVVAEVLDRATEPIGELGVLVDLDLVPRGGATSIAGTNRRTPTATTTTPTAAIAPIHRVRRATEAILVQNRAG